MYSTRHELSEKRTGRSLSLAVTAGSCVYQLFFELQGHNGCAERGEMVWLQEIGMEAQKGAADLRPRWVTPQKEHFTTFLQKQNESGKAVCKAQQSVCVTDKETQHPEVLPVEC